MNFKLHSEYTPTGDQPEAIPFQKITEPTIAFPLSGRVVVRDWSVQPSRTDNAGGSSTTAFGSG